MQVSRQHVVDILRIAGLPELAEEAHRVLPDLVEYNHAARFLLQYGITKDELISRQGEVHNPRRVSLGLGQQTLGAAGPRSISGSPELPGAPRPEPARAAQLAVGGTCVKPVLRGHRDLIPRDGPRVRIRAGERHRPGLDDANRLVRTAVLVQYPCRPAAVIPFDRQHRVDDGRDLLVIDRTMRHPYRVQSITPVSVRTNRNSFFTERASITFDLCRCQADALRFIGGHRLLGPSRLGSFGGMDNLAALVTGANKGIGKEIARQLADACLVVYVGSRDAGRGKRAAGEIGGDTRLLVLDVTDDASITDRHRPGGTRYLGGRPDTGYRLADADR